jgi:hypothetical protein
MILGFATSWPANVWLIRKGIKWLDEQGLSSPPDHPKWVTTAIGVSHCGAGCTLGERGLVRLAYRQYTQTASGPKYNAVIGHTASMTRIGWR